jgi:hypothetical protein
LFFTIPIIGDLTLTSLLLFAVGLVVIWIIVSIPVYIAGKVVTKGESSLGDAMVATLFGPIVYIVTLFVVNFFLNTLIGPNSYFLALILAFIAWLAVFKSSFKTGWLGALAIAILAIIVLAVITWIFGALLGIMVPAPFIPSV